jgi:hypothetical protein
LGPEIQRIELGCGVFRGIPTSLGLGLGKQKALLGGAPLAVEEGVLVLGQALLPLFELVLEQR